MYKRLRKPEWNRRRSITSALFILLALAAIYTSAMVPAGTTRSADIVSKDTGTRNMTEPTTKNYTVRVENDIVSRGLPITVKQGDHVIIKIDIGPQKEADFQIEGYNLSTTVEHGSKPEFEFDATKKGSFEVIFSRREPWEGEVLRKVVGTFYVR